MYLSELEHRDVCASSTLRATRSARRSGSARAGWSSTKCTSTTWPCCPELRRGGVASALLERVLADGAAKGARRATLEVRRSNEAALKLYEKFGFTVAAVRRSYYTHPDEDALVLWRDAPARALIAIEPCLASR